MNKPAKTLGREKLLDYLSNPGNDYIPRYRLSVEVLGKKDPSYIHHLFSVSELDEIESEALGLRRKKYAPALAKADKGLLKRAADGDPAAVKLAYQRFENWTEKGSLNLNHGGPDGGPVEVNVTFIKPQKHGDQ